MEHDAVPPEQLPHLLAPYRVTRPPQPQVVSAEQLAVLLAAYHPRQVPRPRPAQP